MAPKKPGKAADAVDDKGGQPLEPKPLEKAGDDYTWGSTEVEGIEEGEAEESPPAETFSISIELKNDQGKEVSTLPAGGPVKFRITVGGETQEGTLDAKGKAKVDGLPEQACKVSFPEIDGGELKKK